MAKVKAYSLNAELQDKLTIFPLAKLIPNEVFKQMKKIGIKKYGDLNEAFWTNKIEDLTKADSKTLAIIKEWFDEYEVTI